MQTQTNPAAGADHSGTMTPTVPALSVSPIERRLMQRIFDLCRDAIRQACASSSLPPEFLAALAANESGGRADAARFEPSVYRELEAVARGASGAFGSIDAVSLGAEVTDLAAPGDAQLHARYLTPAFAANHYEEITALSDEALRQLSCSWGYTQIMGYHMIGHPGTVRDLLNPDVHFRLAVQLLSEFAADYHLDLASEFSELFSCWNTGRPYGKTFDPHYVENGLRRMQIYRQLPSLVPAAD